MVLFGVMNSPRNNVEEEVEKIVSYGYDFVDLTIEGPMALKPDVTILRRYLHDKKFFFIGHTDPSLPYAYPVASIREGTILELVRCFKIFKDLNIQYANLHPCSVFPPNSKQNSVKSNIEALKDIVKLARDYSLVLMLENTWAPFDNVKVFGKVFEAVPDLKFHLDIGHTNVFPSTSYKEFIRAFKDILVHVHFSDNRGCADQHLPLGVGNVNWKSVVEELKNINYNSTITLEIFCDDEAMRFKYINLSYHYLKEIWSH